jgi:hypothetical protein
MFKMKGYSDPGDQMDALSVVFHACAETSKQPRKAEEKKRKNIRTGTREYLHLVLK